MAIILKYDNDDCECEYRVTYHGNCEDSQIVVLLFGNLHNSHDKSHDIHIHNHHYHILI